jgi:ABC-type uncharacterized transport system involved in gliding motility auxiliary subunit
MSRPGLLAAVQISLVSAILACVVALAALHPWRLDLTPERRFTLSPYTREVLGRVDREVRITVFYSSQAGAIRREMADLLARYREVQPRISIRLLDLDRSPGAAKRLDVSSYNTAVVETDERVERVDLVNEETVSAALLAVAGTPPVPTYFVVGHGERDPRDDGERLGASDGARALGTEGFRVRVLEGAAAVPGDAGLVVLAGPTRDPRPAELEALGAYLRRGGHVVVLVDPGAPPALTAFLRGFGVELAGDLVVDEQSRLFGTDGRSARIAYTNQALVRDPPEVQALLPEAQSMRLVDTPGVVADYLAMTGETTWADVDRRTSTAAAPFRPGQDRHGPLPVAAFVRIPVADGAEGRLLVVGDADFASNLHLGVLGNRDLLLAVANLAARPAPLLSARPPAPPGGTFSPLTLTVHQARTVFWAAVVAPGIIFAALALAMARRQRWT